MKKSSILAWTLAVFMVSSVAIADAADFYVCAETGGAGRTADGSKEKPWKDLQVALDKAQDGDTIHIAEGNYLGTSDRGFLEMPKPVNLKGGYARGFESRDVLKNISKIQPAAANNKSGASSALLTLGKSAAKFAISGELVIDGIIFDRGLSNAYHPDKGKPAGVETGMLIRPPGKGENGTEKNVITIQKALIALAGQGNGNLTIQNCVFANSGFNGILGTWQSGKITIKNNVFVANSFAAVEIPGNSAGAFAYKTEIDFSNNTVLFSWSRLNDLLDMGYGYRFMTGANSVLRNNIIGTSTLAGLDRTRVPKSKDEAAMWKTGVEKNAFFLNRKGDLYIASGGVSMLTIWAENFEDREEIDPYEGNIELSGEMMKGKINEAYLEGFLSMVYSEEVEVPDSAANRFRSAFGLNIEGKMTNKVDMFANRYPLDDALKLFGAVEGFGAQLPQ